MSPVYLNDLLEGLTFRHSPCLRGWAETQPVNLGGHTVWPPTVPRPSSPLLTRRGHARGGLTGTGRCTLTWSEDTGSQTCSRKPLRSRVSAGSVRDEGTHVWTGPRTAPRAVQMDAGSWGEPAAGAKAPLTITSAHMVQRSPRGEKSYQIPRCPRRFQNSPVGSS